MRRSADGRPAAALGPISSEGRSACACGRGCDITSYPWRTGLQRDQSGEKNGSVTAICWLSKKKREPVWSPAPQNGVFPRKTRVIRGRNPGYPPLKERERKEKNSKVKERAPRAHANKSIKQRWMREHGRKKLGGDGMLTLPWGILAGMLAGTAALSACLGLLLGCCLRAADAGGKGAADRAGENRKNRDWEERKDG